MSEMPNILLVVMDSIRAKNCSFHGHDNATTPFLESFCDEATEYTQARSASINSLQSHASIFSGYYPEEHGLSAHSDRLDKDANIWRELKAEHGYETGVFSPNAVITESSNLCTVFDTYSGPKRKTPRAIFENGLTPEDVDAASEAEYLHTVLTSDAPLRGVLNGLYSKFLADSGSYDPLTESADIYVDELLEWISSRTASWAACVNLMDAHLPYIPKEEHDLWGGDRLESLRQQVAKNRKNFDYMAGNRPWGEVQAVEPLYDSCIRQIDAELNRLVAALKDRGEYENTLLVITSDHGQAFGERSRVTPDVRLRGHGYGIHEVLTHVPLIVKHPLQTEGDRIDEVASLAEFPKVVRETVAAGDSVPRFTSEDGVVLSSTDRLKPPADQLPMSADDLEPYFGPWRAVYQHKDGIIHKYTKRRDDECVVKVQDAQISYLADRVTNGEVEFKFGNLRDKGVRGSSETELEDEVEQRLEDLGYR